MEHFGHIMPLVFVGQKCRFLVIWKIIQIFVWFKWYYLKSGTLVLKCLIYYKPFIPKLYLFVPLSHKKTCICIHANFDPSTKIFPPKKLFLPPRPIRTKGKDLGSCTTRQIHIALGHTLLPGQERKHSPVWQTNNDGFGSGVSFFYDLMVIVFVILMSSLSLNPLRLTWCLSPLCKKNGKNDDNVTKKLVKQKPVIYRASFWGTCCA